MDPIIAIVAVVAVLAGIAVYRGLRLSAKKARLDYIQSYEFRPSLSQKVRQKYSQTSDRELELVFEALRDYFLFCSRAEDRMVSNQRVAQSRYLSLGSAFF